MESYIILDGGEFLNMHASSVAKILDLIVGNVNDKGLLSILPVIDILVQVRITSPFRIVATGFMVLMFFYHCD